MTFEKGTDGAVHIWFDDGDRPLCGEAHPRTGDLYAGSIPEPLCTGCVRAYEKQTRPPGGDSWSRRLEGSAEVAP